MSNGKKKKYENESVSRKFCDVWLCVRWVEKRKKKEEGKIMKNTIRGGIGIGGMEVADAVQLRRVCVSGKEHVHGTTAIPTVKMAAWPIPVKFLYTLNTPIIRSLTSQSYESV